MLELAGGEYAVLLPLLSTLEEQAKCVCETKEAGGDTYYRFSEKRAMAWLTCKVKATAAQLAKEDMYKTSFTPDQLTAYSIDLLSEYVSPDWIEKLKEKVTSERPLSSAARNHSLAGIPYPQRALSCAGRNPRGQCVIPSVSH